MTLQGLDMTVEETGEGSPLESRGWVYVDVYEWEHMKEEENTPLCKTK